MKRAVPGFIAAVVLAGSVAFAHGDAEHVRGTVVSVTATAITVEMSPKQTRTVTLNAKTMVMKGDAHLTLKDVKAGDRVVLDVDKKTSVVTEIKLGGAASSTTTTPAPKHKG